MEQEVLSYIKRHKLIKSPSIVLVGVSGGPDSMALLHFLNQYRKELGIKLIAISVNHQLRGEASEADIEYVKEMCQTWKIPFIEESVNVKSYVQKNKTSQQMASRDARYDVYKKTLKKTGANYLALGHHADDQIETMLMALTKVTRPEILSGIPITRTLNGSQIIRPLLSVNKQMIESYCQLHNINPRYDTSNEDIDYERNYFRQKIMPLLQERNPNLYQTAQIMSEKLQEDNQYLEEEARRIFKMILSKQNKEQSMTFNRNEFKKIAKPLQRRVYKLTLDYLYAKNKQELSYEHEEIFMRLINEEVTNQILDFPLGLKLEKSYENIYFYFKTVADQKEFRPIMLEVGTTVQINNGQALSCELIESDIDIKTNNPNVFYVEQQSVKLPLCIRVRKPGDRITWKGLKGSKKVKDVLIDKKIPRVERDKLLIVTDNNDEVLWLIGLIKGLPKKNLGKPPYLKLEYIEA